MSSDRTPAEALASARWDREQGCNCPVMDNAHGLGARSTRGDDAVFWMTSTCPLHGWRTDG